MKVTDIRRKLCAALVAGGVLAPSMGRTADLNVNLVINSGFENVNIASSSGGFRAVEILDWTAGSKVGFAYSHNGALDVNGQSIADYANGGLYTTGTPFTGGGNFYFTSNATTPDVAAPGEVAQRIDVSTGPAAARIAAGNAAFSVRALFNTFGTNQDFGRVHLRFLDSGDASLATAEIGPSTNLQQWTEASSGGAIPAATRAVLVSVYGIAGNGGPDGYIDNVDFRVTDEVLLPALELTIDRTTGAVSLSNRTGLAANFSGYQIGSAAGALEPAQWKSIADNYDADSGGGFDSANVWTKLTKPDAHGDLSEGDLDAGVGGTLGHTQSLALGSAGTWIATPVEDVTFQYVAGGQVVEGLVSYVGGPSLAPGDLNADGDLTAADWAILRSNQHADLTGLSAAQAYRAGDLTGDGRNNHADFAQFKGLFDAANGSGAFVAMLASVPEPTGWTLALASAAGGLTPRRRRHPRTAE
jgi:hypothetical protein